MDSSARTYRMFGRNVRVEFDESHGGEILFRELDVYPEGDGTAEPDLRVRYRPVRSSPGARINPRPHEEYNDGFLMHAQTADVRFYLRDETLVGADFYPTGSQSIAISSLRKLADMQFSSREERAGVAFHELVAVPAAHWVHDLAVVHASAFANPDGDVTLIGGTGGVGKTSLALELCLKHGFAFMADDIAFVGSDGRVWPNLAYPKIYAYNLEDNPDLAKRVLSSRGALDRLHWAIHRRRGPAYVRRRLSPRELYENCNNTGGRLRRYAILFREDRTALKAVEIDAGRAAALSVSLMPAEYFPFYNHLHWHHYSSLADGKAPSITVRDVLQRWEKLLGAVLQDAECLMIRVPLDMHHEAFKDQMGRFLTSRK